MAEAPKKKTQKTLSDKEILNRLSPKWQQAVGFSATHIANKQEEGLKLYNREALPGDNKIKGKSKYVDSSVMERVDWSTASVVRVFDSAQQVVEFLPNGPEDEALARQQTEVVNFIVRSKNSHVASLYPWVKNGFITSLGVVMVSFDACTEEGIAKLIKGVTDEQLVQFTEQEDRGEIIIEEAGEPYDGPMPPQMAQLMQAAPQLVQQNPQLAKAAPALLKMVRAPQVRDLKIRKVYKTRQMKIVNLAPEDFIVSKDADFDQQTGGIKAALQGHKRVMSRDELIEQGFDAEKVKSIPRAQDDTTGIALERSLETDSSQGVGDVHDDVTVYEIFTKMKIVGDKARHYRLTLGGELDNSPVLLDYQEVSKFYPYAAFVPYPLPNTLFGHGVADRVGPDQILLSKIRRAEIDNLNQVNNPIKIVNQSATNMDDALNLFPGSVIRSEAPDGGIKFLTTPSTAGSAATLTNDIKQTLDFTTGVGGGMMAVNASDLQNATATATSQRANSAQQFVELICRQFADTGYRYLFKVIVDLLVQNPEDAQAFITRLTGKYVPIDVDQFSPDLDVTATVAFGVMNKDGNAMMLNQILGIQQGFMGMPNSFVTPQNLYATAVKIAENAGFKNAGAFFTDPSSMPPPPPPPPPVDPNAGLIEIEKVKAQLKAESDQRDYEFQWRKYIADNDLERDRLAQQREIELAKIESDERATIANARIQQEQAAQRNDIDFAIAQQTAQVQAEADHKAKLAEIEAKQKQTDAAIAQAMQPEAPQPPQGM